MQVLFQAQKSFPPIYPQLCFHSRQYDRWSSGGPAEDSDSFTNFGYNPDARADHELKLFSKVSVLLKSSAGPPLLQRSFGSPERVKQISRLPLDQAREIPSDCVVLGDKL